ncbi:cytochrome P450 [Nocardia sp. R6R-6]|uniref:cytochrome P450 n=1 Tax=Nocardia sp. R6R-6 TaxID=3459303 RepID=UPI00403DCE30
MTQISLFDPLDPEMLENPYPRYMLLQKEHPIFWHEGIRSWVVTRYRDCREILLDHTTFAINWTPTGEEIPKSRQHLQSLDPPRQAPLRSLIMNSLHAQDLDGIAQRAREHIRRRFSDLSRRPSFNWMTEVASPVALSITADLLGVEAPDHDSYLEISESIALRMDASLRPENAERGDQARLRVNALADEWFAAEASAGLLKDVKANAARAQVPEHYIHNSVALMFNSSYGTIFATAGNAVLTLLEHPQALERLRDERLLSTGVHELVRFDGPVQGTSRVAVRATEIRGVTIEPGQLVMTALAAANRDPEQFPNPDELVLDRHPNRHLGFGWGTHACVGALVGQIAIRALIVCLLENPVPLRLAGKPVRRPTATVRCMSVLPVAFGE